MALVEEHPIARSGAVMFVYDHHLMLWGGMTQVVLGEGEDRFNIEVNLPEVVEDEEIEMYMEVFNLKTQKWRKETVHGNIPKRCRGSFHAVSGNTLYLFGGYHEEFSSSLYALNLDTFVWQKLPDDPVHAPTPKFLGGMVALGNKLITLGGSGPKNHFTESRGATFLPNESFGNRGSGWNNALHEYNTDNGTWSECSCTGERPPPCDKFTFNQIDKERAILFGGKQSKYKVAYSEVYILSTNNGNMRFEGPYRPQPGQRWPIARGLHAAACLVDPQSDHAFTEQRLMVFWGQGWDAKHVKDIWVLHIHSMTWKQLKILLRPRMFHMSCSYHASDRQTHVIAYGGNKQRQSKFERHVMTDLLIFKFGSVQYLQDMCVKIVTTDQRLYDRALATLPPKIQSILSTTKGVDIACHIIYPHDRFGSIQTLQEMCVRYICSDELLYDHGVTVMPPHFKSALNRTKNAGSSCRIIYPHDVDFH